MDVGAWLRELGLEQYEAAFRENAFDAEVLPRLTTDDLKEMGVVPIGHRRRLLDAIAALQSKSARGDAHVSGPPVDPAGRTGAFETAAERRPLSVMFCDLIGSTALSARLDPEDLREVIRSYQACVASTIQQFNGFIARYVGDGVLIYFGWPQAHETDAARAVRAGLAVATAVSETPVAGQTLQVRIGIATGLVVVGEPIGSGDSRQQTAIGETPNRAARLQGLAGPGQVVIDAATKRQTGGLFECRELGTIELKGLPEPVPAWQVVSENRTLGQFEALRSGLGITPLVGREEEIELLLRRWTQAKAGTGRVVLISAEPGVGKSRLAETLAERLAAEPHIRLRYFCSPHHQDSALYPVIAQMERAAGFAHGDAPEVRLAKLQALLAATEPSSEEVALVAELHGLPSGDLAPSLNLTPQRRKEKTFEALLRQVEALARQRPVLMVFDDLHWIDPSSHELLDRLIERVADWPVLLLDLFRPEFQPPWLGQPQVTALTVTRLDRQDAAAMVSSVAGSVMLTAEVVGEIAERTDGVPLFVEELTKAVLEAGVQAPAALSATPHPALWVPPTLHASLMARLDRLGSAAREVAQAGAAIGRDFGYGLLASITDLSEPQLREALDRLTNAGLVFMRGLPPDASYLFKHALVQDAAYGSLLRSRRQHLHHRIVAVLEERFPEVVQGQPALLAQHCAAAGLAEQAVSYWLKAGQQAFSRSAYTEATGNLEKGMLLIATLPKDLSEQIEINMLATLGLVRSAVMGYAHPEVERAYTRLHELHKENPSAELSFPVLLNLSAFHFARGELCTSQGLGQQFVEIADARADENLRVAAHGILGIILWHKGENLAAQDHCEIAFGLYDLGRHGRLASIYGHDPGSTTLSYLSMAYWSLGFPGKAMQSALDAVKLARRVSHPYSLCFAIAGVLHNLRRNGNTDAVIRWADECISISSEQKFAHWQAVATIYRCWASAQSGYMKESIPDIETSISCLKMTGVEIGLPANLCLLAEVYAQAGYLDKALETVDEVLRIVKKSGGLQYEPLVRCTMGDVILNSNRTGGVTIAESEYYRAICIARRQSGKGWELRAAVRLASLWHRDGRRSDIMNLLSPIRMWFTGDYINNDLREADALLAS